eukprot:9676964-Prorocentrum_lima.AAC.1
MQGSGEWGGYGGTTVPMASTSFPSWQPNNSTPSCSTINPQVTCEYCNCPQAYSYYEDMHPHTDIESEGEDY